MFAAIVIFVLVIIVVCMSQRNEMMRLRLQQREARIESVIPTSAVKTNHTQSQIKCDSVDAYELRIDSLWEICLIFIPMCFIFTNL